MDARLEPGKKKLKETDTLPKALKKKKKGEFPDHENGHYYYYYY